MVLSALILMGKASLNSVDVASCGMPRSTACMSTWLVAPFHVPNRMPASGLML